jgi:hypothetical protein
MEAEEDQIIQLLQKRIALIKDENAKLQADRNTATLIIKPTANAVAKSKEVVREFFEGHGFTIEREGEISASDMQERNILDRHYAAMCKSATMRQPEDLLVRQKERDDFERKFNQKWEDLTPNEVFNAKGFCERFGVDEEDLNKEYWQKGRAVGGQVKLCAGTKCVKVKLLTEAREVYLINGMWYALRNTFTNAANGVHIFVISWNKTICTYRDFREKLMGSVDPASCIHQQESCIRRKFWDNWKELGFAQQGIPSPEFNAVHGSASPFEALVEQMNWLRLDPRRDAFGQRVINAIGEENLNEWVADKVFQLKDGSNVMVFDHLEMLDAEQCLVELERMAQGDAVRKSSALCS